MTSTATGAAAPPTHTPDPTGLAHVELLVNGTYPLSGFMDAKESAAVRETRRLPDGHAWPVPVTLPVPDDLGDAAEVLLTDPEGAPIAHLTVTERWSVAGLAHLAGPVRPVRAPAHGVFRRLRHSPEESRTRRADPDGPLLAVVTDRPLHHRALAQLRAAMTRTGATEVLVLVDAPFDDERTVRAVLAARPHLPDGARVAAVTLPRGDGDASLPPDRVTALAAHVAATHGADHVLVEGPGGAVGPIPLPTEEVAAVPAPWRYDDAAGEWRPAGAAGAREGSAGSAGGTGAGGDGSWPEPDDARVASWLAAGEPLPTWFTPADVATELAAQYPPRSRRGLVLFLTGLSGSGKSTVARGVAERVRESGRTVTLLDGDVVRRMLSAGLTFSRTDRDANIRRIGYVAAEIARHGGLAICAPIAPYAATRAEVRAMVTDAGGDLVLVHVATPLEVCEARDRKGLYARARAGEIPAFTGVSDPYEEPDDADLVLDTTDIDVEDAVATVMTHLRTGGWLPPS